MSDELESKLRDALRPVTPTEDFADRLLARVARESQFSRGNGHPARRRPFARMRWLSAGLAASLLIAVGAQRHIQQRRELENGLQARREVIEALRVTSEKLDLAVRVVREESSSLDRGKPGA